MQCYRCCNLLQGKLVHLTNIRYALLLLCCTISHEVCLCHLLYGAQILKFQCIGSTVNPQIAPLK